MTVGNQFAHNSGFFTCFFLHAQSRHETICNSVSSKKHRLFNSQKQRISGTGIGSVRSSNAPKVQVGGTTNWRQQHEDFITSIRSARTATDAIAKGLPLPPPPPPSINPDYVECPYCLRRFNETAAPRHINFCKTNTNRRVLARPSAVCKLYAKALVLYVKDYQCP
uniref:C2HC/C3H-type domain-containing protein n=1 Tax=Callorhinchus milii TaxID=7868 RepID=A0A4W3I5Q1_CALMI